MTSLGLYFILRNVNFVLRHQMKYQAIYTLNRKHLNYKRLQMINNLPSAIRAAFVKCVLQELYTKAIITHL